MIKLLIKTILMSKNLNELKADCLQSISQSLNMIKIEPIEEADVNFFLSRFESTPNFEFEMIFQFVEEYMKFLFNKTKSNPFEIARSVIYKNRWSAPLLNEEDFRYYSIDFLKEVENTIMECIDYRMQIIMPILTKHMQMNPFRFIPETLLKEMAVNETEH